MYGVSASVSSGAHSSNSSQVSGARSGSPAAEKWSLLK